MNYMKKVAAVILAVVLLASAFSLTASASTQTIELTTRSALLVDRSGSIKDQDEVNELLKNIYQTQFDFVGYFDNRQISLDPTYLGGSNSAICETIDEVAKLGYTHITVITDGQQWPKNYSSLGVYSDLDLTIVLVGDKEESEELINHLKERLVNSNLKVIKPDGQEEVILNGYQPPVYSFELPAGNSAADQEGNTSDVDNEGDKTFIQNIKEGYFPWWLVLLLAVLIAAIFDFIHELITQGRVEDKKEEPQQQASTPTTLPVPKPIPAKAIAQIAGGAHVLADYSGSMAAQQSETAKACQAAQKGSNAVLCFGDSVSEHAADELTGLQASGQTHGWEAMEEAAAKGWDELVLVSDLGFNGKAFDESAFSKNFKKITIVTPTGCHQPTLENIRKIAEEVEVLSL